MDSIIGIKNSKKGEITTVQINGRLDAISAPVAEKHIFDLINDGNTQLLLDFTNVSYLSSAGMRTLLSTTKKLRALSGKLVVCSVKDNVMDILKMSGFDHVLDLVKTEEDALKKFQIHV